MEVEEIELGKCLPSVKVTGTFAWSLKAMRSFIVKAAHEVPIAVSQVDDDFDKILYPWQGSIAVFVVSAS